MRNNQMALVAVIVVLLLALGALAYDRYHRPQTPGEKIGNAIEKVGDAVEDAADDVQDGLKRKN